jgi:hypothetical protein
MILFCHGDKETQSIVATIREPHGQTHLMLI